MDVTAHVSVVGPGSRSLLAYSHSGRRGPEELAAFLPPRSDPGYLAVLTELVRADLEHNWAAGTPLRLDAYVAHFPDLFTDPYSAAVLTAVEARLRGSVERSRSFGGRLSAYRLPALDQTPPPASYIPVGQYERTREVPTPRATDARSMGDPLLTASRSTRPAPDSPRLASRFPAVGDTFCGFKLVGELGSGAFARVFLAEQTALAGRPVALKVTTRPTREPQQLAKLRHTNVVPIYSVHDDPPLQAVCMPFLGRQTLADLVKEYRTTGIFPGTAAHSTVAQAGGTTVNSSHKSGPHPALPPAAPAAAPAAATDPAEASHPALVLRLVARLADGLAHAHEVGILHLDLKPANVLLADDGQPLLLDFNLAFDVRTGNRERTGGTLPYMAPEQLDEYVERGATQVDHRTDLYALGVMVFELLTGRHPFPMPPGGKANPGAMAKARRAGPPSVRALNPAVSPAVESIVRTLLQPDPARRYQSARDLLTDLDRHRQNLPLAVAPDTSPSERLRKWRRRNPRLLAHLLLAGVVLAAGGLGFAAFRQAHARDRAEAVGQARAVRGELARLRVGLTSRNEVKDRADALARGRAVLADCGLQDDGGWANPPKKVRILPEAERAVLGDDLGELALLMAHAEGLNGRGKPDAERAAAAGRALAWNRAAEPCYAGRTAPAALAAQRTRLCDGPRQATLDIDQASITDLYLYAVSLTADGRFADAVKPLLELTRRDPAHYGGQFTLALCRQETGDLPSALERYQVAQALDESDPRPAYNRGLLLILNARANPEKYRLAETEFTDAIQRDPTHAGAYKHRAIVRTALPNDRGAVEDLTKALELGDAAIQVRYLRARVYDRLGDKAAADADRTAAAALPPADPMDYLVRGHTRAKDDPAGALADFEKAAELNPHYLHAWQNQAHVLADVLDQPAQALAAQEKAVACCPDFALARTGRAVLYARLGRRDDAHKDAQAALVLSEDSLVTYQVACAYALTGAKHPEDLPRAVSYFRKTLRDGYQDWKTIDSDPDLKAVRGLPEFREALDAAKRLAKK